MVNVIQALFLRELKTRFGKNRYLGYFWVVGEPLMQILVITTVITLIREYITHLFVPGGTPVFMFLACGIIPFFMFRNIITQLMGGIAGNLSLFFYKPVRPIHVFLARTLLEFYIYSLIFVCVMILAGWFIGYDVAPRDFLAMFSSVVLIVLSGFSFGMIFAIITHFFEPLKIILTYFIVALYFLSCVIFPIWIIPSEILKYMLYNPMLHICESIKHYYLVGYPLTDGINLIYPLVFNILMLFIGFWFYYYKRRELVASRP
ncbi:capsular polysaccharide ABC transporter permease [Campylobacter hyointestinalis subsp. hyointestinalis]|uniref:Transport permease protein n=1 Tax=Campylobacter hyointestinalis subsp. hyointestinalis TaxID=91352 RepID=A0A9W5ATE9_CAMHY|nr:ABC transporter permease [Campylobacter hyointestinalis]CUU70430.1 capsular polysaccharide ABC transporter permease [Campylobacter hyointestinalis subsp. hyointestinalis]CUU70434.1 capsular polysaccharide ABC transporter permease [Campylobacter hyointestinalis subsp. hyointestinalis]CUU85757.1 capsular polysaccharide ABC transporter permease [Campylobacter hyointestinalis subsp. hyointestinalis]